MLEASLSTGVTLRYAAQGDPAGVPVVLLHGYALADHVADVAAFLDAAGHEAAVVVGHSFGSYTAQQFAIDHPERTVALAGIVAAVPPTEAGLITAPTRIIWGDRDQYCPRGDQLKLAEAIPGAELLVYEGTGHAVHWEEPARVAADVAAFITRAPRRPRLAEVR